ncbi:MAG: DUF6804 family protein [Candidatus Paceibacterota bacterium]|jgi:TRAP-type uncharacterized transport system fused permease subunit
MNNFLKQNWFKVIAIILLLWALTDNQYSYYQFVRWAIMIIGGYSAYLSYTVNKNEWAWTFSIIAILFNPIIPFYFSKNSWQILDIIVAIIFSYSLINRKTK